MCEHPIYITNPTKRYGQFTKVGFHVPCGKCPACRQAMRDEWFLRAYSEYRDTVDAGGKVYFPTLTYAPASLPLFNTKTGKLCHNEKKYGKYDYCVPCFSKHDVKRYIKTMRKTFERLGLKGIKYLVCSEFGDEKGRPHYHCLIYVPNNNLGDIKVQSILLNSWKFGIAFWSPLGAEIQSLNGILYVTKYVTKDLTFTENEYIKDFELTSKRNRDILKEFMPKHYQSKFFGIELYKWLTSKENIEDYIERGVGADYLGLDCDREYAIPKYIRDKIMYKIDENGCRVPSDYGQIVTLKLLHMRINKAMRNYSKFFTVQGLQQKINSDDCHEVIKHIEKYEYTNDYKGLCHFLADKMCGRTLQELAIYKFCYRDMQCPDEECLAAIEDKTIDELEALGYAFTEASFDDDYYDVYSQSVKKLGFFADTMLWNQAKRFVDFEMILGVIQRINSLASKRRQRKKDSDDKTTNNLKNNLIK